ncbi:MAG: hypothetical protein ACHQHN_19245 [Sphingobacteriales bacterium]
MKKLLFGLCIIAISAAFFPAQQNKPIKASPKAPGDKTLNGIDYDSAIGMINNFNTDYPSDVGLKSACAWFNKDEIQKMQTELTRQIGVIDGVRFYLGEASKNGTELKIEILMLATQLKAPAQVTTGHTSIYGDYPLKNSSISNQLGQYYSSQAFKALSDGGLLYGDHQPAMGGPCSNPDVHLLNSNDAYTWVQKRHDIDDPTPNKRDKSAYNTKGEWFDACFISTLFDAILKDSNNLDGLRVYLGEGRLDEYNKARDVVILVPTHQDVDDANVHKDDFRCLQLIPTSFCAPPAGGRFKRAKPTNAELLRLFNAKYLKTNNSYMAGVYDNGELCPDVCN